MQSNLVKFESPPIVEMVLGVQFEPLREWTAAHAGWFWRTYLGDGWSKTEDAHKLENQFERFGALGWMKPGVQLQQADPKVRTQIISDDDERLIQVQDTRFVYNWRKRGGSYPSFEHLLPAFREHFAKFIRFVGEAKLGELRLNQWEMIYVDIIEKGALWNSPADWGAVLPSLATPTGDLASVSLETVNHGWHFKLPDDRGRLHVTARHVRIASEEGNEALRLDFTARGPAESEAGCLNGFDLGHSAAVRCFLAMTSEDAHRRWGRS